MSFEDLNMKKGEEDKKGDPLESFHTEGIQESKDLKEEEYFLNEEEERLFENEIKENRWIKMENMTESDDFTNYIGEIRDNSLDFQEEGLIQILEEEEAKEIADFGDRDISAEEIAKYKKENPIENVKEIGGYTLEKFRAMEEAAKYRAILDAQPKLDALRPTLSAPLSLDEEQRKTFIGEKLSLPEIMQLANEYKTIKNNHTGVIDSQNEYTLADIKLMDKCNNWITLYNEANKDKQIPSVQGKILSNEQIDSLANDYKNLKENKSSDFALLKVESGEWNKDNFDWKESTYKDKKQFIADKQITNKDGNIKKIRYVIRNIPDGYNFKDFYSPFYVIKDWLKVKGKDDLFMAFIDLKSSSSPTKTKREKSETVTAKN